ncbi:LysM peptidoglycan-binding domain-containing protein [Neolewinella antarctica]|uniref:LysM repeat protein n=1 Tax=Neolewinella antarctica TaxID=442734 RepID=A0ABX0XB42_9BACT|nr:LysM peptidoglycan-binding domain-containing protein [Neolewinella antarctica]NJC26285.1 LysM repeat protein [Neolewinella antarctica]
MYRFILLLACAICTTTSVSAEHLYILTDGGCADRVRYHQGMTTQMRTDYYAYHFRLADGSRLMLETGPEAGTVQTYLPVGSIDCDDSRLDARLLNRVTSGTDQITILRVALNGQYYASPVISGSLLSHKDGILSYRSKLVDLRLDEQYAQINDDVTARSTSARVVFQGLEDGPCGGAFLFQQADPQGANTFISYRISPQIGLMERRLGSDGLSVSGGVVVARAVNGRPVLDYLASECQRLRGGSPRIVASTPETNVQQPQGEVYASTTTTYPQTYQTSTPVNTGYGNNPVARTTVMDQPESRAALGTTAPVATGQTHTVVKGETLYAISRRYGTNPAAIKRLNALTGNTIYPGQVLTVTGTDSAPAAPASPADQAQVSTYVYTPPVATAPAPVTQSAATPAYPSGDNTTVVKPGQTVASLALTYGYTEARFRQFNNLGPNDFLYANQRVKIDHCDCLAQGPPTTYNDVPNQPVMLPPTQLNQPATAAPQEQPRAYGSAPAYASVPQAAASSDELSGNPQVGTDFQPSTYGAPSFSTSPPVGNADGTKPDPRPSANAASATYPAPATAPRPYGGPARTDNVYLGSPPTGAASAAGQTSTEVPPTPVYARRSHVVQENEDVYIIARAYNMTPSELRAINGMRPGEVVAPAQKLYLN